MKEKTKGSGIALRSNNCAIVSNINNNCINNPISSNNEFTRFTKEDAKEKDDKTERIKDEKSARIAKEERKGKDEQKVIPKNKNEFKPKQNNNNNAKAYKINDDYEVSLKLI